MVPKLHIDIGQGILDIEGDEAFVLKIYSDFKEQLAERKLGKAGQAGIETERTPSSKVKKVKSTKAVKPALNIDKSLHLAKEGTNPSLKDYYKAYKLKTNFERNLVFVYYLQKIREIEYIDISKIYTCYKDVGQRVPGNLQQSLYDTAHSRGWLDTKSLTDIKIAVPGENYIENDMEKVG